MNMVILRTCATTASVPLLMHLLLLSTPTATTAFTAVGALRCQDRRVLAVVRSSPPMGGPRGANDDYGDAVPTSGSAQVARRRRDVLRSAVAAASLVGSSAGDGGGVPAAASAAASDLLVDLPMIRFRYPGSSVDYAGVRVCLDGRRDEEPVEFMLDTGLTLEMMTPRLGEKLGLKSRRTGISGITAGGVTSSNSDIVAWTGASLCGGGGGDGGASGGADAAFPLPELHAIVSDFPQEYIDPEHPIEGMLGQELLSRYDLDLDFRANRLRLYRPGTAARGIDLASRGGMVEIPSVEINETRLIGIRLTPAAPDAATGDGRRQPQQPVLAFLDCGSTFSVINTKAAALWGLPTSSQDPVYTNGPKMLAVGVDGKPMELPTITQSFSFAGEARKDPTTGRLLGFDPPPAQWKPWKGVQIAVADLPVFPELLGDGITPYQGPAALLGLDVLSQRRVIFEAAAAGMEKSRRRRLFVSAA
ncbi:hypothetical protein ACHAXA_007026 [Cyclostephanos tholiformis]|uniref:Peptidase A2 domain-containing protein n=1 Tax=Cyclostephanos tholiformis TaxID=382380 RepID=A0ABD3RBI5_9STRA